MLKIGLTGGIGSGKTICAKAFSMLGIPIFNSDLQSRYLMETNAELKSNIRDAFGNTVFLDNGMPDRKKIAELVFSDKNKLALLNSIVHPAVFLSFNQWVSQCDPQYPYIIKEAAILFESGADQGTDYNIMVYSEIEVRIARAMLRDNISREQMMARIARQMPEEEKIKRSDHLIYNDDFHSILLQVVHLDSVFREIGF